MNQQTGIRRDASRLGYLPALDGLRAVAIGMVLVDHVHPRLYPGGRLGVDVFFALSGFLITTLIVEETERLRGRFGYRNFYLRRALRLFPALYAMLAVVGVYVAVRWARFPDFLVGTGIHDPDYRRQFPKFFLAAATYTTDLFGMAAKPGNFLGHTWSLAVEEQFYLLWPIVLVVALRRFSARRLMVLLVGFVLLCAVLRVGSVPHSGEFLGQRPEGLALGALVALLRLRVPAFSEALRRVGGWLGWAMLAAVLLLGAAADHVVSPQTMSRGVYSVVAVVAALLVAVVAIAPAPSLDRLLSWRPVVWTGTISYGLYIWHFPIFRILTWELRDLPTPAAMPLKLGAAFVVAALSMRVVEAPARRLQARFRAPQLPTPEPVRAAPAATPAQ